MLFFADSAERAVVQATMMGGVAVVITSMLLLLWFLDNPYHSGLGGLRPTAMERTLALLDEQARRRRARLGGALRRAGGCLLSADGRRALATRAPVELLSTLLLTLAAVATAWATLSGGALPQRAGARGKSLDRGPRRGEPGRRRSRTGRSRSTSATFFQWVDAYQQGDAKLAAFYLRRFRPEFRARRHARGSRRSR